jgi:hypothetical protein
MPKSPAAWRGTEPALPSLIYVVLPEQHNHAPKQPHGLLFERRWWDLLFPSELVS